MSRITAIVFLLLSAFTTAQEEVSFTSAVSRTRLALNERLRVEFKMNVDGDNFTPPAFEGFKVMAGPSQSVSQRWVNGRSSMSKTYSYVLEPSKTGRLTIQQGVITYRGNEYKTTPILVNVTGAVNKPREQGDNTPRANHQVHLVAEVSKVSPYLNEPIRVVYKIYVAENTGVSGWNEVDSPKYADFWSQNIDNRNRQVQQGTYQGEPYRYLVLREAVLYPQKTGKLEIEPLTLDINVEVPTNRRDFFGRPYTKTEQLRVSAGKREITVRDFPAAGRPASFNGAVGQFDFELDVDQAQLDAGESLTASLIVSGSGNLKLMQLPELKVPSSLEVYEPERVDNVRTNIDGMSGSIRDNYTIVPQYGGKYVIPPVDFSYFDPQQEKYITLNSGETLIQVEGDAPTSSGAVAANPGSGTNVISSDAQFAFIKTETDLEDKNKTYFFNTRAYWGVMGGLILLLPLVLILRSAQEKRNADVVGNRLRTANRLSKKYLSAARKNLGNHEAFYISLEKSLHNYLKSKLNIQTADMSKDRVNELLKERGADEQTRTEFTQLLASCEFARYTPSSDATMKQDYEKAGRVLTSIDKQLKR